MFGVVLLNEARTCFILSVATAYMSEILFQILASPKALPQVSWLSSFIKQCVVMCGCVS